jgi:hypothetical protein
MKKILFPLVSIFAVVALVAGVAYAQFNDTVAVNGMTFATGDNDLKISLNNVDYADEVPLEDQTSLLFESLYPGYTSNGMNFWLQNNAIVDYTITGKLTNEFTQADWTALRYVVLVGIADDGNEPVTDDYHSLYDWKNTGYQLPSNPLTAGHTRRYRMFVRVPTTVGNEIANKKLEGMRFEFTGTQV